MECIPSHIFLEVVRPRLADGDPEALAKAVSARWRVKDVVMLLRDPDVNVRRVAAMVLGLIGNITAAPALIRSLRDTDEQVNRMAEHSLWSIWFRAGSDECCADFQQGIALSDIESYNKAVEHFEKAIACDPDFAEAYNQCAIAHYLAGRWRESLHCACEAVKRVPTHFGALAGMGHSYAQLGHLDMALRCYRHALRINPHMPGIAAAKRRLAAVQHIQQRANELSGEFAIDEIPV